MNLPGRLSSKNSRIQNFKWTRLNIVCISMHCGCLLERIIKINSVCAFAPFIMSAAWQTSNIHSVKWMKFFSLKINPWYGQNELLIFNIYLVMWGGGANLIPTLRRQHSLKNRQETHTAQADYPCRW